MILLNEHLELKEKFDQLEILEEKILELRKNIVEIAESIKRIYIVEGYGHHTLSKQFHFVGSLENCRQWVNERKDLTLIEDEMGRKIISDKTKKDKHGYLEGRITCPDPLTIKWFSALEIYQIQENKKLGDYHEQA